MKHIFNIQIISMQAVALEDRKGSMEFSFEQTCFVWPDFPAYVHPIWKFGTGFNTASQWILI